MYPDPADINELIERTGHAQPQDVPPMAARPNEPAAALALRLAAS